jgi:hypothetical protein
MFKKNRILWVLLVIFVFVAMVGGCGGGGNSSRAPVPEADVTLSGLVLSAGALSPAFSPSVTNYTAAVNNATASVTVTATAAAPDDVEISVNGVSAVSGRGSVISLNTGVNTINILVSALDDFDALTSYVVTVTRGETPEDTEDGFYIPMQVTQEELDDIWRNGRIDLKLDTMLLPDGSYVKDYLDVPLPWSVAGSSARSAQEESTPITRVTFNAALARIMVRALDLTNRDLDDATRNTNFSVGDVKAQEIDHSDFDGWDTNYNAKTKSGQRFGQKRYVYIWRIQDQLGECDTPKQQNRFAYSFTKENGDTEDVYKPAGPAMDGIECVGFVRECLYATGIPASPSQDPTTKFTKDNLNAVWFQNSWLKIEDKSDEKDSSPPLPGDILVFPGHVALCARLDTNGDGVTEIAIVHSTGKTGGVYTSQEYKDSQALDADAIGIALNSNGPMAQNYQWSIDQNK